MEKVDKDKFYSDLKKYKALCDVVLTIYAIAENSEHRKDNLITERVLLSNLIDQLEVLEAVGYSNANGYILYKLYDGSLDGRFGLIRNLSAEILRSNEDTIPASFLLPRVDEITDYFDKRLDVDNIKIPLRVNVDIIKLLRKHHDLLLKFIFSNAGEYQRTEFLTSLINDTNNYHTFSKVADEFKTDGINLNFDFKVYNLYRKKYRELINRINFYGNSRRIILERIYDTDFVIDFINNGASISYSDIIEYFERDVLNNLNITLLNILIENHKNQGNLNVRFNYINDCVFYNHVNKIFIEYIKSANFKNAAVGLDIKFSPFVTEYTSSDGNRDFVMYPEWNDKLYTEIVAWIKEYIDQISDYVLEFLDEDQFVSNICAKIIAKSLDHAQTDECVGKTNKLYDEILNYIVSRKEQIKSNKMQLTAWSNKENK